LAVTAAVVVTNVTEDAPAGTLTLVGVEAEEELSDTLTAAPPAGAAPESVTVQVLGSKPATAVGEHCSEETVRPWAD
jgi:hypothetical protein